MPCGTTRLGVGHLVLNQVRIDQHWQLKIPIHNSENMQSRRTKSTLRRLIGTVKKKGSQLLDPTKQKYLTSNLTKLRRVPPGFVTPSQLNTHCPLGPTAPRRSVEVVAVHVLSVKYVSK